MGQLYNWGTISGANPSTANGISYPASLSSTIAVGASTDFDYRSDYSQYGNNLDFVAPSNGGYAGITTTDRTGEDGYNKAGTGNDYPVPDPLSDTNYTSTFGGTSSASPLAAGIGALLLSKNPNLTASQIRTIMRDSADEIGSVTYVAGFNQYYGYGRVNAAAALDLITDAPTEVDLVPGATGDTGVYENDDLTKLDNHDVSNTLDFYVSGTINEADVTLYANGYEIGSGTGNGGTITITTNGTHDLADGINDITARQEVSGKLESPDSPALEVTVDTQAATVSEEEINNAALQRNSIDKIEFTFSEDVSVESDAFEMYWYDQEDWVKQTISTEFSTTSNTATWEIDTIFENGYLRAVLVSSMIQDLSGNYLDGDYSFGLYKLSGDMNGDKVQSAADIQKLFELLGEENEDYNLYGNNYITSEDVGELVENIFLTGMGDADLDGDVDDIDLALLLSHWGEQSGQEWGDGDFDGDGDVDDSDLALLLNGWGVYELELIGEGEFVTEYGEDGEEPDWP